MQLDLVRPQFTGAAERRKRIEILAPTSGRVVNLAASTIGGVIRPGAHIMEIVPARQELIVNTGERTVVAYLAQPVSERMARTFIE